MSEDDVGDGECATVPMRVMGNVPDPVLLTMNSDCDCDSDGDSESNSVLRGTVTLPGSVLLNTVTELVMVTVTDSVVPGIVTVPMTVTMSMTMAVLMTVPMTVTVLD